MAARRDRRSRADQVRRRRSHPGGSSSRQVTSRRKRAARASTLPPVVARRSSLPIDLEVRKRGKTRRRYDIALGVPGAEVRLPSLPVVRLGWRTVSGLVVVGLLVVLYTLLNSPTYRVEAADVVGVERLTSQEINTVMKVAGETIFNVEPQQLQNDLQAAFPELYDIDIRVGFPAVVRVSVEERQPVLAWTQDGLTLWIDELGVAFPPRGTVGSLAAVEAFDTPPLPIQSPGDSQVFLNPEMIPAILAVGEYLPEDTSLLYDARHGLGWTDLQGWQVFFGPSGREIETRLAIYHALVTRLEEEQVQPGLISVEYLHAPYYRLDR